MTTLTLYYADWSEPSRLLLTTWKTLKEEYKGRLKLLAVNTDKSPEEACKLELKALPTIVVEETGQRKIGAASLDTLRSWLNKELLV